MISEVMEYLPQRIQEKLKGYINKKAQDENNNKYTKDTANIENSIEEIRLRINQNLTIKIGQELIMINYKVTKNDLTEAFENICEKSIYSYTKQISEGFITIRGGNRVGLTGSSVMENGKVVNINYVSSLNFRIAREIKEVSAPILKYVIDIQNDTIFNTIIASPPGARKNDDIKRFNKKNIKWNTRDKFFS